MKSRRVLIIASSGGGGLLQAAHAKEQEELEKDPSTVIIKRDMLKEWYGQKHIRAWGIKQWDRSQRSGDIKKLKWLYTWQSTGDWVFWPFVFFFSLTTFFKEDIDHVIDTQPLGLSAVLSALRIFNFFRKKNIVLEKVAVDLPTDRNTHFFQPIKKLSRKNRAHLRLITISPLLHAAQTADEFWQHHCNLSEKEVIYEYVVRRAFSSLKGVKQVRVPFVLSLEFQNDDERALIDKVISRGSLHYELGEKTGRYLIRPLDRVVTVLLGSQPTTSATANYVKKFIEWGRLSKEPLHLFVYCAEHVPGTLSLLSKIAEQIQDEENYPAHVTVIPFSIQKDEAIASLFYRSDITCTRSGGQTVTELMCVRRGDIWIHSESEVAAEENPSLEKLLEGFLGWEAGNAIYMHKKFGAKIVTPELITQILMVDKKL